jgi:Rrf2 family protein
MKLITRDTDYAIRAILYMAKKKRTSISVPELTKTLGIPRAFLRRILQKLSKNKILKSQKGKGGGFELSVLPKKIRVMDLMKIFQGEVEFSKCTFKKGICPDIKTCPMRKKIKGLEEVIVKRLGKIDIGSLLKEEE